MLLLCPVVVGGGKPALPRGVRLDLELLDQRRFANGAIYLRYAVRNPFDPEDNIRGGVQYLRFLQETFPGRLPLVVAAYNAGENAVLRHGGIPPYAETQAYVRRILDLVRDARHPFESSVTAPSPELKRILARGGDRLTDERGAGPLLLLALGSVLAGEVAGRFVFYGLVRRPGD